MKSMKAAIAGLMITSCLCASAYPGRVEDKIAVLKKDDVVCIRSWFSAEQDVLIRMHKGGNGQIGFFNTRLIAAETPLEQTGTVESKIMHHTGDDSTVLFVNGTAIGGNHGLFGVVNMTVEGHGFDAADIGGKWKDAKGSIFYLIKIVNANTLWFLAENTGTPEKWEFKTAIDTSSFSNVNTGKTITVKKSDLVQMCPAVRINKQEYLIDGKTPLQEGNPVICNTLDGVESYDIIAPDSVLEKIKKNPGKTCDFAAPDLESLLTRDSVYQFQPRGVCLTIQRVKMNRDLVIGFTSPVMTAPLVSQANSTYEYYIPDTLPFEVDGVKYDFNAIHNFKVPIKNTVEFRGKNIDSVNPPHRFIQMVGEDGIRQVGFAMGFDGTVGLGKPSELSKNTSLPVYIYKTGKTYPAIIDHKAGLLKTGTVLEMVGYRKYLNLTEYVNPTCVYFYRNGNALMLYIDYHKPVNNDAIKLPAELTGKKITVIEKTPSLKLLSGDTIAKEGINVSVEGNHGYIVIKAE